MPITLTLPTVNGSSGTWGSLVNAALGALRDYVNGLATVATTGAYADLIGKPTIPATFADLTGSVAAGQLPTVTPATATFTSANAATQARPTGVTGVVLWIGDATTAGVTPAHAAAGDPILRST